MSIKFSLRLLMTAVLFSLLALSAHAADLVVNGTGDPDNSMGSCSSNGACSLRQAINAAASGDTITFNLAGANCPAGVCTINLTIGILNIDKGLTIVGTGARNLIVRRGDGTNPLMFTIFNVAPLAPANVNISGITISNGSSIGGAGGIFNDGPAQLTLNGVAVTGNAGAAAGGIANRTGSLILINSVVANNVGDSGGITNFSGTVTIANSTISGNRGTEPGLAGGITNGFGTFTAVTLNLNNVTIANNTETASDSVNVGGVKNFGVANARNTIIAGNTSTAGIKDFSGTFFSQGTNLVQTLGGFGFGGPGSGDILGQQPFLGALGNFGGQTDTLFLSNAFPFVSPALNTGNSCVVTASCTVNNPPVPLVFDQRGAPYTRNSGAMVDIGAYELQPDPTPIGGGTITGRVFAPLGGGLSKALVILVETGGVVHQTPTNPFGVFRFDKIPNGQMVTVSILVKGLQYVPQAINMTNATPNLNFLPQ
jgi:hypothetical protein